MKEEKSLFKKSVYRSMYLSIVSIFLLLVCFSTMTWAFFSDSKSTKATIKSGNFKVIACKVNEDNSCDPITGEEFEVKNGEKYRFVKSGNTAGYFELNAPENKEIVGLFKSTDPDQSYYEITVNTNIDNQKIKIEGVKWGGYKGNVTPIEDNPKPKLMLAASVSESETVVLHDLDPYNLVFGNCTISYDNNIVRLPDDYQEIRYVELDGDQYIALNKASGTYRFDVKASDSINYNNLTSYERKHIEKDEDENETEVVDYSFNLDENGVGELKESICLYLFGSNINDEFVSNDFINRVYEISIYQNEEIKNQLIPCVNSDEEVGFFDLINNSFIKLQGSEYEEEIEEVSYIDGRVVGFVELDEVEDIEVKYNKDNIYEITYPEKEIDGFVFEGWSTSKDKKDIIEKNEDGTYYIDINSEKLVLHAIWSIEKYSITYSEDTPSGIDLPREYTLADNIKLPILSKKGYEFVGWFDSNDNKVDSLTNCKGNIELHSQWQLITYSIEYKDILDDSLPTEFSVEDEVSFPNVEKDGYLFSGWLRYIDEENTEPIETTNGLTENIIVSPQWVAIEETENVE